jgi:hypothetical protein
MTSFQCLRSIQSCIYFIARLRIHRAYHNHYYVSCAMLSPREPHSGHERCSSVPSTNSATPESENPFIAFRRFADSQFSSLVQSFTGIPWLFAEPGPTEHWAKMEKLMAKRRDALFQRRDGWMEALEHDAPELSADPKSTDRREKEMQKWGAVSDTTRRDRPRWGQASDGESASKCPEKLGWDGKQRSGASTNSQCGKGNKFRERFWVQTAQGEVDLHPVVDDRNEDRGVWVAEEDARLQFANLTDQDPFSQPDQALPWLLTDDYSPLYLDRTLPYKLHPSFYIMDAEDSCFRKECQGGDVHPRFAAQSVSRHDPRIADMVNWRDAFHDLLDVHHRGERSSLANARDEVGSFSPLIGPGTWISYLISAGSLGSQWHVSSVPGSAFQPYRFRYGNSSNAWAVWPRMGRLFVRDGTGMFPLAPFGEYEPKNDSLAVISQTFDSTPISRDLLGQIESRSSAKLEQAMTAEANQTAEAQQHLRMLSETMEDNEWRSFRPAFTKAAFSLIRNPDTEQSTLRTVDRVLRLIENPELEDEVEKILSRTFSGIDPTSLRLFKDWFKGADDVLHRDHSEEWKAAKQAVDAEHPEVYGVKFTEPETELASTPSSSSSSASASASSVSSSSYSYIYDSASHTQPPTSIISMLTTVETRTLPDGRLETKTVLKKRFADGREENTESLETQMARMDCSGAEEAEVGARKGGAVEVSAPAQVLEAVGKEKKKGGWFWA